MRPALGKAIAVEESNVKDFGNIMKAEKNLERILRRLLGVLQQRLGDASELLPAVIPSEPTIASSQYPLSAVCPVSTAARRSFLPR